MASIVVEAEVTPGGFDDSDVDVFSIVLCDCVTSEASHVLGACASESAGPDSIDADDVCCMSWA